MSWRKQRKIRNFFHPNKKGNYKIDKHGNQNVETISYKIKFIDV